MSDDRENLDIGLEKIFDSFFASKHFCMPAIVVTFDAALQTVSVQPALKSLLLGQPTATPLPIIEDVPVVFPGGGDFVLTFDILPGAYVLLVFAERSIENWADLGGIADPLSTRKCDLSDAIAIPGLFPTPSILVPGVDATALTLRNKLKTTYITLTATSIEVKTPTTDITLSATDVKINGGNLQVLV